ncbi:hypothetical protein LDO26_11960 [Luteimonas sp. BDR2-5]|uniref:hypothetical protein n=1 Tax=Proluteimonas luteida TaxID=2878685 RepID=UPI001E63CBA4|nr:hypothetical protein [Luteimonas sp. BDR2-5]MCD9028923.1 hypothetical protein [Luteimonas sp. BDR2-5]
MNRRLPDLLSRLLPLALLLALAACTAPAPVAGDAAPAPPGADAAAAPGPALDRSCRVDSDCAVKNVGNCCGYQPACVNAAAEPDPAAVQADCARRGMAGVCGFVDIEACSCVASRCEPADGGRLLR